MSVRLLRMGEATGKRIGLNPLDVFEYPIPADFAFVFRQAVEPAALEASLRETLRYYPEYTGRLRRDGNELYVACDDVGAGFAVKDSALSVHDLSEAELAEQSMAPFFADNAWLRCCDRDVPLLVVQLNRTAGGGMVLGVETIHALADGASLVDLVRNWARVHRGESPVISPMKRNDYASFFNVRAPEASDPDRVPGFKRMSRLMLAWKVLKLTWDARSTTSVVLPFGRAELDELKSDASSSSSSALFAHLWKIFAERRPNANRDATGLFMVLGTRHLRDQAIDRDYHGNAVWHVRAESTYGEVRTDPLARLAANVQAAQSSLTYDEVCIGMQWMANEQERGNLEFGVVPDYELMRRDFFATNISRLPFYEADFGTGPPMWVNTKPSPMRWMIRIFPRPSGDGILAHCTVPKSWKSMLASPALQRQLHPYAETL